MEPPHSPEIDVKVLRKDFEFSGIPDRITTTLSYNEVTTPSPKRREERKNETKER